MQDPYFSEQSVEKEKGIIGQEIKMYDDQPDWQSFMGTIKAMFKNHPINIDIAGTVESISKITKDDLYTCYYTFYHPENMTLCITGNFNPEQMMNLIKSNQASKEFKKMDEINRYLPNEPKEVAMKEHHIKMPVSVPKCTVGIKESSEEISGEEFLKKDLLQNMIVDYYFSKGGSFYQELYQEKLIDDSFYFETTLDKNYGYTLIGSNSDEPQVFSNKVKELLLSTRDETLSEKDFNRMKKKKIGRLLRSMNSLEFMANKYTHYHISKVDLFDIIPTIQALQLEEANQFLKEWIEEERLAVCTISAE